jgi:hypothetical protein
MAELQKFRKRPAETEACQWFKNGDHPHDDCHMVTPDPRSTTQFEPFLSEGKVVRRFNFPNVSGESLHGECGQPMRDHGWIDTGKSGFIVCPEDWIITGEDGEYYPCKPDAFAATYELIDQPR